MIIRLTFLGWMFAAPAMAASLVLSNDRATGGPGKFAAEAIRTGTLDTLKDSDHTPQLTGQWQEHIVEFEINTAFKDATTLRFAMPRDVKGEFDLADTRLKRAE